MLSEKKPISILRKLNPVVSHSEHGMKIACGVELQIWFMCVKQQRSPAIMDELPPRIRQTRIPVRMRTISPPCRVCHVPKWMIRDIATICLDARRDCYA